MRDGIVFLCLGVLAAGCAGEGPAAPNRVPPDEDGKADGSIDRATWVARQIRRWNADLADEVRAEKYQEMARSPLAFFRATNHLFWADHVRDPRLGRYGGPDTWTFLGGDVHPENFGAYDVDGRVVYDLNDVDDSIPGEAQLDVWRLAVGITLLAEARHLAAADAVDAMTGAYLETLGALAAGDEERSRTFTAETTDGALAAFLDKTATKESRAGLLEKWTLLGDGARRLNTGLDKLAPVEPAVEAELSEALFWHAVKAVGQRLHAGVASLGQPRYYVLV